MLHNVTHVAFGLDLVGMSPSGQIYVLSKVASRAWAILEIGVNDLLLLLHCQDMPRLDAARCVALASTKKQCLAEYEQLKRRMRDSAQVRNEADNLTRTEDHQ